MSSTLEIAVPLLANHDGTSTSGGSLAHLLRSASLRLAELGEGDTFTAFIVCAGPNLADVGRAPEVIPDGFA
jgi:hypothetical protein